MYSYTGIIKTYGESMKNEITNKHDATFKEIFSQERIAKDFINIQQYKENDFEKLNALTAMMLTALKDAFGKDKSTIVRNFIIAVEKVEKEETKETLLYYMKIYLEYIALAKKEISKEDLETEIRKLDGKGAVTMNLLQKTREEGLQEGLQKGLQKGKLELAKSLLKDNMEIALVAKYTGLSTSELEKIKKTL